MSTETVERPAAPKFSAAGLFLEALAERDFARLAATLAADARLNALIPPGPREWHGPAEIAARFRHWFGDTEEFDFAEANVGEIGSRLHLRWRIRLRARRLGDGWFAVEQQVYADTGPDGRLTTLALLCSGYCPERPHTLAS